ncbi:MAG: hypothetical protein K5666_03670 [Bacilli bacterium]|nr:hypothetical protein [Bacilli bacterium]
MANDAFAYKRLFELKKMSLEELSSYYRQLRSYEHDTGKPLKSSTIKRKIYFLTKLILKIDRLLSGRKLILFDDKRENNTDKGKVYASSHVGRYDIESAMEAIGEQAYFVMGDPEETYRNFEGFFLDRFYGRICLDTGYNIFEIFRKHHQGIPLSELEQTLYDEYKKDRHLCEVVCTRRVAQKDNLLIYPEGAWNVTPNITQNLFPGAAKIAVNGNGVIVPVGILRDGKKYSVNIGKEMDITGATESDVKDITKELKENMSSLVYEMVFAGDKVVERSSLSTPEENEQAFIDDIMAETENGYTLDVIEKSRFHDKDYYDNIGESTHKKGL